MLTDNDKRDIEKQTGVALDKDQKGRIARFHKGNSLQVQSDSRDAQPVRFEFDCIFESIESKLVFHSEV